MINLASFGAGFVAGFGTGFVSREIASALKPAAKAAFKSSVTLFEKGKEGMAHFGETLEDLMAEAKSELAFAGAKLKRTDTPKAKEKAPKKKAKIRYSRTKRSGATAASQGSEAAEAGQAQEPIKEEAI